jgi:hypothetical protein
MPKRKKTEENEDPSESELGNWPDWDDDTYSAVQYTNADDDLSWKTVDVSETALASANEGGFHSLRELSGDEYVMEELGGARVLKAHVRNASASASASACVVAEPPKKKQRTVKIAEKSSSIPIPHKSLKLKCPLCHSISTSGLLNMFLVFIISTLYNMS